MKNTPFQDYQRNQRRLAFAEKLCKGIVALVVLGLLASSIPW